MLVPKLLKPAMTGVAKLCGADVYDKVKHISANKVGVGIERKRDTNLKCEGVGEGNVLIPPTASCRLWCPWLWTHHQSQCL